MSKIKGTIKEIHWVTTWQYNCINRDCPICRSPIELSSNSGICIGTCGHGFHRECLLEWFKQGNEHKCPVCNKKWCEKKLETTSKTETESNNLNNNIF